MTITYKTNVVLTALLLNGWAQKGLYQVHKSRFLNDGQLCTRGHYFVVMATLPDGLVSVRYRIEDWELFAIPEQLTALHPYDYSVPDLLVERLESLLEYEKAIKSAISNMTQIICSHPPEAVASGICSICNKVLPDR